MTGELEQVMAALRSAGWRGTERQLVTTAMKRLATARHHEEQADARRASAGKFADRHREESRRYLAEALRNEVRAAERRGEMTRTVRDVALRLVPSFPGNCEDLLDTAQAIASVPQACAGELERTVLAPGGGPGLSGPSWKMSP